MEFNDYNFDLDEWTINELMAWKFKNRIYYEQMEYEQLKSEKKTPQDIFVEHLDRELTTDIDTTEIQYFEILNKIINKEEINILDFDKFINQLHLTILRRKYIYNFWSIKKTERVSEKIRKILYNLELLKKINEYSTFYGIEVLDFNNADQIFAAEIYKEQISAEKEYLEYLHSQRHNKLIQQLL